MSSVMIPSAPASSSWVISARSLMVHTCSSRPSPCARRMNEGLATRPGAWAQRTCQRDSLRASSPAWRMVKERYPHLPKYGRNLVPGE